MTMSIRHWTGWLLIKSLHTKVRGIDVLDLISVTPPNPWQTALAQSRWSLETGEDRRVAMTTQSNPITVIQYEHSFEELPGFRDELINGKIVMTPQPKPLHQHIRKNLERLLDAACQG